uniref:Uncharacterized protein n=1 Tax=Vespula pensylvanica TaxID=30213 RepID=A0A834P0P4_VESPE|nr:hypothetical protein H0235_008735 [Vespula pensylvanica]
MSRCIYILGKLDPILDKLQWLEDCDKEKASFSFYRQHHDPTVKRYSNGRALNFGRPKKLAGYVRNTYVHAAR